jgi:hypothetical protein
MSLEKELVFESMDEGLPEQEVLDRVEGMRELGVDMNPKIVQVDMSQYRSKKELEKRDEYKESSKEKLKELLEKKIEKTKNSHPTLLSIKLRKKGGHLGFLDSFYCDNCKKYAAEEYFAKIKYLNGKGEIPTPKVKKETLLTYCRMCGIIDEVEIEKEE